MNSDSIAIAGGKILQANKFVEKKILVIEHGKISRITNHVPKGAGTYAAHFA
jgi:imidazolonepropionase-like amidohydrolase